MDGVTTFVEMTGPINEHAKFGELRLGQKLNINLTGVTALNSVGTRTWCLWIQRFRPPLEVILEGCPPIIVKSFTSVKGFLPDHCVVRTFVIPFYSEITGESRDFIAVRGHHFDAQGRLHLPELKDAEGNRMEMDVVPDIYLAFLKK